MRRILLAATVFVALAVIHTWPLATSPARLSRNDASDAQLNAWIVSWVAHQLPRNPSRLFDANIFYPESNTLALSEPLLVPGALAIPVRAAGASPILTYNVLLLAGFVVTGLGMYVFAQSLTGDHYAGLLAGSAAAFNSHILTRLPHLQAAYAGGVPLALWILYRLMRDGRTRDATLLAIVFTLTATTSGYLAAFTVFAAAAMFVTGADLWWPERRRVLPRMAVAIVIAATVLLPLVAVYARAHDQSIARPIEEVALYSAVPASYLTTLSRLHYDLWSARFYAVTHEKLFPGVVVLAFAGVWLVKPSHWRNASTRILLAIALAGVVLSLGPATPIYRAAYRWIEPLQDLRAAGRFGYLAIVGVAGLGAFGLAHLRQTLRPRVALAVAIAALVLANAEAFHGPMPYVRFDGFSPIYAYLAKSNAGAVVEFPLYSGEAIFKNSPYVLASTEHWRPLVNGYSGAVPESFDRTARALRQFPSGGALRALRRRGVTHLVIHLDAYDDDDAEEILRDIARLPELELVAQDRDARVYRLAAG